VVESPWSYQFIRQLLDDPTIQLDAVIVPIRRLEEAATSRIIVESQQMYRSQPFLLELADRWTEWGGYSRWFDLLAAAADAARILAPSFHRLIEALVQREIPLHFLAFPRFCTDLEYIRRVLTPVLPADLDATKFADRINPLIERQKIRVEEDIIETNREVINESSEPAYPELSTLHEESLKREVKRLLTELSEARAQLGDMPNGSSFESFWQILEPPSLNSRGTYANELATARG
jgi:hypothetical protein